MDILNDDQWLTVRSLSYNISIIHRRMLASYLQGLIDCRELDAETAMVLDHVEDLFIRTQQANIVSEFLQLIKALSPQGIQEVRTAFVTQIFPILDLEVAEMQDIQEHDIEAETEGSGETDHEAISDVSRLSSPFVSDVSFPSQSGR
jgi:hypothetical protein